MNETQPDHSESGTEKWASGRRRVWLLLPILLCLAGAAYYMQATAPKTWRAEAQIEILPPMLSALSSLPGAIQPPPLESMEAYVSLIQSNEMARRTLNEMTNEAMMRGRPSNSIALTLDQIQKAVTVINPPGTRLLDITADASDREQAAQIAEATARGVASWRQNNARISVMVATQNLKKESAQARQMVALAGRQEIQYKTKIRTNGASDDLQGTLLRQNTEIATKLYQQLQTALDMALLQQNSVSGDVLIVQHGIVPLEPQQNWGMFAPRP